MTPASAGRKILSWSPPVTTGMGMSTSWRAAVTCLKVQADALLDMTNVHTNPVPVNRRTNWRCLVTEQSPFQVGKPTVLLHLRRPSLASQPSPVVLVQQSQNNIPTTTVVRISRRSTDDSGARNDIRSDSWCGRKPNVICSDI